MQRMYEVKEITFTRGGFVVGIISVVLGKLGVSFRSFYILTNIYGF